MRKLLLVVLLLSLSASAVCAIELRLMTGPEEGIYYQLGQEMSAVTDSTGVHLQVLPSQGSWENIVELFNSNTEFAIFQVDAFVKASKNLYQNTSARIEDEIHVVMPLYWEEVHLLKARDNNLDFSKQKRFVVGCGMASSGSCLTAAVIEELYGKKFQYLYDDYATAIDQLKGGTVDLVVITAGKPYPLLIGESGLELIPLPQLRQAANFYSRAILGPEDYPWLDHEVSTYTVRSVLATMIHEEEGLANDLVGSVHFSLRVNETELKKNGHPKWNDVLFNSYNPDLGHVGALRSLTVCKVLKDFGYRCTDMVSGK